jgi:hypothetical protein
MDYLYFHDAAKKMVIAAPAEPMAFERKGASPRRPYWTVQADLDIIRADNYFDPKLHRWRHPVMEPHGESYTNRDDRQAAIRFFKQNHYPSLPTISQEEYLRLRKEYEDQARHNKA